MGLAGIMKLIFDIFEQKQVAETLKKTVLVVLCLSLLLPITAYSNNHFECDRSKNYLPFYYAYNLLMSCRENAVLFTNGDNDTFPVWCLQYGYGIRPDVRVIVLSLLRSEWYIAEQRDKFDVPITLSDFQIKSLQPFLINDSLYMVSNQVTDHIIDNALVKSKYPERWPELPMTYGEFQKRIDSTRLNSDTTLYFDPPIHFSTTVDPNGLKYKYTGIEHRRVDAVIEGMVHNIHPLKVPYKINIDFTWDYFINTFNAQGVNDTSLYKDVTARRLADNYWKIIARLADEIFAQGGQEEALEMNVRSVEIATQPVNAFRFLAKNLMNAGRIDEIYDYMDMFPNVSREGMMEISCRIYDVMFNSEVNQLRRQIKSEAYDQNMINSLAAKQMYETENYRDYLRFLDDFTAKYANNQ
jgi:hypothetical protein